MFCSTPPPPALPFPLHGVGQQEVLTRSPEDAGTGLWDFLASRTTSLNKPGSPCQFPGSDVLLQAQEGG